MCEMALVQLAAERFHLFLQLELLSLEFLESEVVGGGPSKFVLNGFFERLVAGSEFTNPGFQRHDGWPPSLLDGEE